MRKNKQQNLIDKLKNKIAGKEVIKWEDVKRKEGQNSLYNLSWLDKNQNTSLAIIENKECEIIKRDKFLADLDKQIQPGRNINEYRELKSFLVEQADLIKNKTGLNQSDLQDKLNKLDDLIVETNVARYEDAAERLADDKSFEELSKAREDYYKAVNTLALETVVQKQLKSSKNTVNLLSILKGEDEK